MRFSFVLPVIEFRDVLKQTILAILRFDGLAGDFEILIIQNGERVRPPEWVSDIPEVRCLYHPVRSIPVARNLGIQNTSGEYVIFLDEDSVCSADWLLKAQRFFASEHMGAFQSPSMNRGRVIRHEEFYLQGSQYHGIILFDTAASIFRKTALDDVGGFDESFKRLEDNDMGTRLSRYGWSIAYGEDPVGGIDRLSLFKSFRVFIENTKHLKRLYLKYGIPLRIRLFSEHFSFFKDWSQKSTILYRLILKYLPVEATPLFTEKHKNRLVTFFQNEEGKLSLVKNRFHLLFTKQKVILLAGHTKVLESDDAYLYQSFFEGKKTLVIELSKIKDEKFLEKIKPLLTF